MFNQYPKSPIHLAIECCDIPSIKENLKCPGDINWQTRDGVSALHYLAFYSSTLPPAEGQHCFELMLAHGVDVNAKDTEGRTPLHYFFNPGGEWLIKCLVDAGADIDAVSDLGVTPLYQAVLLNNPRIEPILKKLLKLGANLEYRNPRTGYTPLLVACKSASVDSCRALLRWGANIHATDDTGLGVLHFLAESCALDGIRELISAGAAIDSTDNVGQTPLMYACFWGALSAVELLLELGADRWKLDTDNQSALDYANQINDRALRIRIAEILTN